MSKCRIILKSLSDRFLQSVISLWLITVLFFVIIELSPHDYANFGAGRGATASMIEVGRRVFVADSVFMTDLPAR